MASRRTGEEEEEFSIMGHCFLSFAEGKKMSNAQRTTDKYKSPSRRPQSVGQRLFDEKSFIEDFAILLFQLWRSIEKRLEASRLYIYFLHRRRRRRRSGNTRYENALH